MKFTAVASVLCLVVPLGHGFLSPSIPSMRCNKKTLLRSSPADEQRMKEIMAEESLNEESMAASAKALKNMTPQDIDQMLLEMDQMPAAQIEQLKSMGMDPEVMKTSMKMMKEKPELIQSMGEMIESMSPEELMEKSREAQERMAKLSTGATNAVIEAEAPAAEEDGEDESTVIEEVPLEGSSKDPDVVDAMFRVAEMMSKPPSGGVTFAAFATLPPITVLSGDREEDLSKKELADCWANGSLGSTRVDRQGFERVWLEVQDYFEGDIMNEARKTSTAKPKKPKTTTAPAPKPPSAPVTPVGTNLTAEQMSAVRDMSEQDMNAMLDQMGSMTPEQEARMKAMGVDPAMMRKTAEVMKNNPMMRKAAQAMVKNMSPDQMLKTSQQAQQQMSKMSKEEYEAAMEQMMKQQGE